MASGREIPRLCSLATSLLSTPSISAKLAYCGTAGTLPVLLCPLRGADGGAVEKHASRGAREDKRRSPSPHIGGADARLASSLHG
jgi:hypothetical protein